MKHYAVTGRLWVDDEDSCVCMEAASMEGAIRKFKSVIRGERDRDEIKERELFINYVLESEAPIFVVASPNW